MTRGVHVVHPCLLTALSCAGGKSVNILGPINGLAMSNLGKANFGRACQPLFLLLLRLMTALC